MSLEKTKDTMVNVIEQRLANNLIATFLISWIIFHWNFLYTAAFVDQTKIFDVHHVLKQEFLAREYFNYLGYYFWLHSLAPFVSTYLIIWKLPDWVLLKAHKKDVEFRKQETLVRLRAEKEIAAEKEQVVVQEERVIEKQIKVTKKQEEKIALQDSLDIKVIKAKEAEGAQWSNEFEEFKKHGLYLKFHLILDSVYEHSGDRSWKDDFAFNVTSVPTDLLAYCDTNGIILIDNIKNKISLTSKGKYFVSHYSQK